VDQETKKADKLFAADILILPTCACIMIVVSDNGGMDMQSFLI
jgi:hypothetical protein